MLKMKYYDVRIRLVEPMLGTVPKNKEVYTAHIAAKARQRAEKVGMTAGGEPTADATVMDRLVAEEVETIEEVEERGWTGFHHDDRGPFIYNYLVKGNLCEGARALRKWGNVSFLQDKVKRYVFVRPRRIYLPELSPEPNERALRAQTPQGPRVTVVQSDVVPAGSELAYQLHVLNGGGVTMGTLEDILGYGEYVGLGQWRTGGLTSCSISTRSRTPASRGKL